MISGGYSDDRRGGSFGTGLRHSDRDSERVNRALRKREGSGNDHDQAENQAQ